MTFFNQFHKEVTERKMRKIAASQQSPMNSNDFAQYIYFAVTKIQTNYYRTNFFL